MLNLKPFDPRSAPKKDWAAFHVFRRARHEEIFPEDPFEPDQLAELQMKQTRPSYDVKRFALWDGDSLTGFFETWAITPANPGYELNKHMISVDGGLLKSQRRRGNFKQVAKIGAQVARERGATTVSFWTIEQDGMDALDAVGAKRVLVESENRLDFSKVDWELMEEWVSAGPGRSPGTKLELYEDQLPDALLKDYSPVYTKVMSNIPIEESSSGDFVVTPETFQDQRRRHQELGKLHHTLISRETDGAISGLTEMKYQPELPEHIYQDLTGVLTEYQGRGLGKWLKASMLLWIKGAYPTLRWVVTGNANSNAPMLAINHAMGFFPYKRMEEHELSVEQLEAMN